MCGIDRGVKVRRKCVFGCVNSMPGGRFMQVFMIFEGFDEFGWILGNVENLYILRFSTTFRSCRNVIALKRCGIYKKSIETCRRPPFRVCGATTPCAAPALPERGVLARVSSSICRARLRFRSTGRGGAKVWQIHKKLPPRKSRHTSGVESIFT